MSSISMQSALENSKRILSVLTGLPDLAVFSAEAMRTNRTQLQPDWLAIQKLSQNRPHTPPAPVAFTQGQRSRHRACLSTPHSITLGSYAHRSSPGPRVALGSNLSHSLAHQGYAHLHHPSCCAKKCSDLSHTDPKRGIVNKHAA